MSTVHPGGPPIAYPINDACKALGVKRSYLYELLARGELRAKKLGRRTVIERCELERFVAAQPDADIGIGSDRVGGGA
jgi:excisionase family DNA binding protein